MAPVSVPELYASLIYIDLVGLDEAAAAEQLRARLAGYRPAAPPRFPAGVPPAVGKPAFAGVLPGGGERAGAQSALRRPGRAAGRLRRRLQAGGHTLVVQALHGLGGVGKTQLAIEYAHRFAADYHWLLIFDNAQRPQELTGYLPGGAGQVLVTSRQPGWGPSVAG